MCEPGKGKGPDQPATSDLHGVPVGNALALNRTTLVVGPSGAGKTIFALQGVGTAASSGQSSLFISFSQTRDQLLNSGERFDWRLDELEREKLLVMLRLPDFLVNHDPGLYVMLEGALAAFSPRLVILDAVDRWLGPIGHPESVHEALRLRDWLAQHQCSATLTVLSDPPELAEPNSHPLGLAADCTVVLDHWPGTGTAGRLLRAWRYRGVEVHDCQIPLMIGRAGIEVLLQEPQGVTPAITTGLNGTDLERVRHELSNRVLALDRFLEIKQAELDYLLEHKSALDIPWPSLPVVQENQRSLLPPGQSPHHRRSAP